MYILWCKASEVQIKSLVTGSIECEQSISFNCVNSPLSTRRGELAWWKGLDGKSKDEAMIPSSNVLRIFFCEFF